MTENQSYRNQSYDFRHERVKTTGRIEAFSGNVKIDFSAVTEN